MLAKNPFTALGYLRQTNVVQKMKMFYESCKLARKYTVGGIHFDWYKVVIM